MLAAIAALTLPNLQMCKLRIREGKGIVRGHPAVSERKSRYAERPAWWFLEKKDSPLSCPSAPLSTQLINSGPYLCGLWLSLKEPHNQKQEVSPY